MASRAIQITPSGHVSVLLTEAVAALRPAPDGRYLDGTFGGGGHTRAILDASAPSGMVMALDADPAAMERASELSSELGDPGRLVSAHANFRELARVVREAEFGPLDGVLLDLGLSSFQLDQAERGFAFRLDGPLDMRFDPTSGCPASVLVNELPENELADLIYRFGEEPKSRRIAAAVVRVRNERPITMTAELASIVAQAAGGRRGETHPATRTFQALRIATNAEFVALEAALTGAVDVLKPGGRLVVISFHSLEDRIVKRFIAHEASACICPPEQPICTCEKIPRLTKVGKAIRPDASEQASNPRSRSATLRIAERLPHRDDDSTSKATEGRAR